MVLAIPASVIADDAVPATRTPADLVAEPMPPTILHGSAIPATGRVQVWIDLAIPAVPSMAMQASRAAYRHAVDAQQEVLAVRLRELGGVELMRVRLVRNSIAVELPAEAIDTVRQLPGVLRVRPVIHLHHIGPPPPSR